MNKTHQNPLGFFLVLFSLSIISCGKLKSDVFSGKVLDSKTSTGIPDAGIELQWRKCDNCANVDNETKTDQSGNFGMKERLDRNTRYALCIYAAGYHTQNIIFNSADDMSKFKNMKIFLEKK